MVITVQVLKGMTDVAAEKDANQQENGLNESIKEIRYNINYGFAQLQKLKHPITGREKMYI